MTTFFTWDKLQGLLIFPSIFCFYNTITAQVYNWLGLMITSKTGTVEFRGRKKIQYNSANKLGGGGGGGAWWVTHPSLRSVAQTLDPTLCRKLGSCLLIPASQSISQSINQSISQSVQIMSVHTYSPICFNLYQPE